MKLPARRFGFSVSQEDVGAPANRNAIAPTEIRPTSIATSFVFSFDPLLARELRIQLSCNRTLLPGQPSLSKSPNQENSRLVALILLPRLTIDANRLAQIVFLLNLSLLGSFEIALVHASITKRKVFSTHHPALRLMITSTL